MSKYDGEPSDRRENDGFARQAAEHFPRADLKAYRDGELAALRRFIVQRHLARCADCREEVRWLKRLGEDMRDLERAVPRPELRARILANLPETPPVPKPAEKASWERASPAINRGSLIGRGLRPAFGVAVLAFVLGGAFALPRLFSGASGTPAPVVTTPGNGSAAPSVPIAQNPLSVGPSRSATRRIANNTPVPWDQSPSHYTDQISREAQQLYLKRKADDLAEEARRQRAQRQEQADAGNAGRRMPAPTETKPPVQLALAVNDLHAARENLSSLAKRLGGTLSTPDRQPGSRETDVSASPPFSADHPAERPLVLAMNIPAERMNALTDALGRMGTLSRIAADQPGSPSSGGQAFDKRMQLLPQSGEESTPSQSGAKRALKLDATTSLLLQTPRGVLRRNARAFSPDLPEDKQRPFVTVLIRLRQAGPGG